jgi:hypothetical protein
VICRSGGGLQQPERAVSTSAPCELKGAPWTKVRLRPWVFGGSESPRRIAKAGFGKIRTYRFRICREVRLFPIFTPAVRRVCSVCSVLQLGFSRRSVQRDLKALND